MLNTYIDGIIVAIVWIGFVVFTLLMLDCAVTTLKNGTSIL